MTEVARAGAFHRIVAGSGAPWIVRRMLQQRRATILGYHDPDPATMREHLRVLSSRFRFVTLADIVAWIGGGPAPPPGALVVTLDDGWAGNRELAPVFAEVGVRPTVFVCTGIVGTNRRFWWQSVDGRQLQEDLKRLDDAERLARLAEFGFEETADAAGDAAALSLSQLAELAAWADVQSHTRLHPILPHCDDERAWAEIEGSRRDLEAMVGGAVYALAYPNGDFSDRDRQMVARAGYTCAVGMRSGFVGLGGDLFSLHRIPVSDDASADELLVKVSGIHDVTRRALKALKVIPDWS
jgi:peptidoglycan/xylan/chitin deacetylase (PgdA/CDA1 family)